MESCSTINIAAFVARELSPAERDVAEAHFDQCAGCRRIAVSLAVPDSRRHAPRLSPGDRVDQYVIERFLGSGGMGTVYAAEDRDLGRRVALKVLDAEAEPTIEGEARALARLSHPNVITVYGVGRVADATYVAAEVVDGLPLQRWVATTRPSSAELAALFVAVASALRATHAAGLVHRDVKPENIVVSIHGVPRLIDFGLAHVTHDPSQETSADGSPTETTLAAGTLRYMAPEQRRGEADRRSDQYSFCVTLEEMLLLAGHRPSRALRAAIVRGRAVRAEDRFADLQPLVKRLQQLEHNDSRRRRGLGLGLTLGLGAAAAVTGVVSVRGEPDASNEVRLVERSEPVAQAAAGPSWAPGTVERIETRIGSGDARRAATEARALLEQSEVDEDRAGQVEALRLLALALDHQNLPDEALEAISAGLRVTELADLPLQTARLWTHRASLGIEAGDFEGAMRSADFAHFLLAREGELESVLAVKVLVVRGEALRRLDKTEEARGILTQAREQAMHFDPAEANIAELTLSLGYMLLESDEPGDWERGRELLEEGFAVALDVSGPNSHPAMVYAATLAKAARKLGADEEALVWIGRALDSARGVYGPDNPYLYRLLTNRVELWRALPGGEFGTRLLLEHYDSRLISLVGPEHPSVAVAQQHLGRIAMADGRTEDAVLAYARVLAIRERTYGTEHAMLTVPLEALEACQRRLGHTILADAHATQLAKIKGPAPETASPPPD